MKESLFSVVHSLLLENCDSDISDKWIPIARRREGMFEGCVVGQIQWIGQFWLTWLAEVNGDLSKEAYAALSRVHAEEDFRFWFTTFIIPHGGEIELPSF